MVQTPYFRLALETLPITRYLIPYALSPFARRPPRKFSRDARHLTALKQASTMATLESERCYFLTVLRRGPLGVTL